MIAIATTSSVHELLDWLTGALARGVERFELWIKPRGADQRAVVPFEAEADLWNVADAALTVVQRDRRAEQGLVSYAMFGFRAGETAPAERAFVAPPVAAVAIPVGSELAMRTSTAAEIAPVLQPVLSTVHATFELLQRENEHQRKANEVHLRAATGHFDALARGYERTFSELQRRLDAALAESTELRTKIQAFDVERDQWKNVSDQLTAMLEEVHKVKASEQVESQQKLQRSRLLTEAASLAMPLVAALATKTPLSGGGPAGPVISRFLASLTEGQLGAISSLLSPAQQAILMMVLNQPSAQGAAAPGEGGPPVAEEPAPSTAPADAPEAEAATTPEAPAAGAADEEPAAETPDDTSAASPSP